MKTYNVSPYFDDFDESKNFHQIMFKPGVAVQARELTQLQTILRDQIEKFGNHIFKHGSVVIPGNSFADLATPYIKLQPTFSGNDIIPSDFEGNVVVGNTTGIRAYVQKAVASTETDPATLYLSYFNGSAEGNIVFADNEEIYLESDTNIRALTQASSSSGAGSLAFINEGVYYINGSFVFVEKQSVVIDKYSSSPSCSVLLEIKENVVTSIDDETLLDPAQGSYNYAAPGANRVQITLTLVTLPLGTPLSQNYVEIMRYKEGILEEHAKTPKYSELEKSLARRTFDESGNYVVNGLKVAVKEHLKTNTNFGVYTGGDPDLLVAEVDPGRAYINGFEVSKISKTRINVPKARGTDHIKNTSVVVRPEYGQYILVTGLVGTLSIRDRQIIDIYNDNDPNESSATKIGTARVIGIDLLTGDPSTGLIYKLFITDLTLESSYTIESAGGIRYGSGKYGTVLTEYIAPISGGGFTYSEVISNISGRTATVHYWNVNTGQLFAFKHDHTKETPRIGDLITGASSGTTSTISSKRIIESDGQSGLIFNLPKTVLFSLRDPQTNSYNLSYTVQKELSITTNSSGNGSVSVSSGEEVLQPEAGTFIAIGPSGVISNNLFSLNTNGTILSIENGPPSSVIKVYAAVEKTNVSPKTKTLASNTEVITSPGNTVILEKTDIIGITSVIDSTGDVTANYSFSNGQTSHAYTRGRLILKSGATPPSGNLTISYTYYQHSVPGDFFTIDSYPEGILDSTTVFVTSTGTKYNLPACLDFRPSVGEDGEFTGTESRKNDLIVSGTTFTSSLQFYVPRIDTLVVNSAGNISVVTGSPSEEPRAPDVPKNQFPLNVLYIPEYTKSSTDVKSRRLSVQRYTMRDIDNVTKRIDRIENFTTLSAVEQGTINFEIPDAATGLNRFKTGYVVENFTKPLVMARSTFPGFASTFVAGNLEPSMEDIICPLELLENSSSNYVVSGNRVMLPYTEEVFAEQNLSSRVTNVNPFLVIRWNGILDVNPSTDSWVETRDLATIFDEETETVTVNNYVPCPPGRNEPDPAPVPNPVVSTTYGGLYGEILGRGGEDEGVIYWVERAKEVSDEELINEFVEAATRNYESGGESTLSAEGIRQVLAGDAARDEFGKLIITQTTFERGSGSTATVGKYSDASMFSYVNS